MLATVQPSSTATLLEAPNQNVTLIYNPAATNPGEILTFNEPPFIFITEISETITVTLQNPENTSDAVFTGSSTSIFPHSASDPGFNVSFDSSHLVATITVGDLPEHLLRPLGVTLNINLNATGEPSEAVIMTSPAIFLILGPAPSNNSTTATLTYSRDSGTFSMGDAIPFTNLLVLVNPIAPPSATSPFNIIFQLPSTGDDSDVTFNASTPIVFDAGQPPGINLSLSSNAKELTLSIFQNASRLVSFRFAVDVPTSGTPVTVTSPDPILINATIGDG